MPTIAPAKIDDNGTYCIACTARQATDANVLTACCGAETVTVRRVQWTPREGDGREDKFDRRDFVGEAAYTDEDLGRSRRWNS